MILKVGSVSHWLNKNWTTNWLDRSISSLESACLQLVYKKPEHSEVVVEASTTDDAAPSQDDNQFYYPFEEEQNLIDSDEGHLLKFKRALALEIEIFLSNFTDKQTISAELNNTAAFWLKSRRRLPILYQLMVCILCLPASTAYVERFFKCLWRDLQKSSHEYERRANHHKMPPQG